MQPTVLPRTSVGHIPGEAGVWVLILGDMFAFSAFFAVFLVHRARNVALFSVSQAALERRFGLLNTALLLTSSLFVARAVIAARAGAPRRSARLLVLALGCGGGVGVSKGFGWGGEIATGIHLLHVLVGIGVLTYLLARSRRGDPGASYVAVMEGGGAFWHMVDLIWVVLFALFYLLR